MTRSKFFVDILQGVASLASTRSESERVIASVSKASPPTFPSFSRFRSCSLFLSLLGTTLRDLICGGITRLNTSPHTQAESGFDTTAAGKRVRLAAVPGGARRHACIVNALAEFRRLIHRQKENGDGKRGGGCEGSGGGADGSGDKTPMVSTAYAPPSGTPGFEGWRSVCLGCLVVSTPMLIKNERK